MDNFNPVYFDKKQEGIAKAVALQEATNLVKSLIDNGAVKTEKKAIKSLKSFYGINRELLG